MHLRIKVITNAKREYIVQTRPGSFDVWLREKPEDNKANKRLLEVLGDYFKMPVKRFKIVRGHKKPTKLVLMREAIHTSSDIIKK